MFALFEFLAEVSSVVFAAEPFEAVFFFVFENGVIKVLGFAAAKSFDDGMLLVTDRYFHGRIPGIAADKDIDACWVSTEILDGVIIRAVDKLKIRSNRLLVPNVVFHVSFAAPQGWCPRDEFYSGCKNVNLERLLQGASGIVLGKS